MSGPQQPDPRRYMQVADMLRGQIADGILTAGQPVPITALRGELGYAPQTISRALHLLAAEGLIYRIHGLPYYVRGGRYQPVRTGEDRLHQPDRLQTADQLPAPAKLRAAVVRACA